MFNMLIMGPPGAGKGTQAQGIAKRLGLKHLSSGDVLRGEVAAKSAKGLEAGAFMASGALVPDELMTSIVGGQIKASCASGNGALLDGYPRTVPQARALTSMMETEELALHTVVNLQVADEELVDRLVNRLTCPKCTKVFHKKNAPPAKVGICDDCGTALASRPDDTEVVIKNRLDKYHNETQPVIDYYRQRGLLKEFDGSGPINEVFECVVSYLEKLKGA